jgi:hypothetical protein
VGRLNLNNVLAVVLPLVVVLGSAWLTVFQVRRMRDLESQRRQVEQSIAITQNSIASLEALPPLNRIPTEPFAPKEQVDFLNTLRAYADATRVKLVNWTNATPLAPISPSNPAADSQEPGSTLPRGVIPIGSAVVISGTYANVRDFLYYLLRSPRLFSMTDLRWSRSEQYPNTTVSFTLTRYVTRPGDNVPAAGGSSAERNPLIEARPLYRPAEIGAPSGTGSTGRGAP